MESLLTASHQESPAKVSVSDGPEAKELSKFIQDVLDENSAQDVIEIDIRGKSSIADYLHLNNNLFAHDPHSSYFHQVFL